MVNITGKNQYRCPAPDDPEFLTALVAYHIAGVSNAEILSSILLKEHFMEVSARTIYRRRAELGLSGSGKTTANLPTTVIRQLVLDQLQLDPLSRKGPNTIREAIRIATGLYLTRDVVRTEMRLHDKQGFELRAPGAKKVHRTPLIALGPHHEWSADGHDKLTSIGFPIWGIRDKWSGKWLGLWVIPNNRLKDTVAYLYLSVVYVLGGTVTGPLISTTDCGSETVLIFALANALRDAFSNLDGDNPAHRFMRSIHNITVERGWFRLRLQWGDNIKAIYEAGADRYNPADPDQYELHQWLWPKFIQQELDDLRYQFNNHVTRFDRNKVLPSNISPNVAMSLHEEWGGENCLQPVNRQVVWELMQEIGDQSIRFVEAEFAARAEAIYGFLGCPELSAITVWTVFWRMLPLTRSERHSAYTMEDLHRFLDY